MADVAEPQREVADLQQQLQDEVTALRRVMEITSMLNSTLKLDELLEMIIKSAAELLNAESASLLLVDEETGDLIFEVATGGAPKGRRTRRHAYEEPDLVKTRVPAGQGIAGWVVQHDETLVIDDPQSDSRFYSGIDKMTGFETRNILAIPLKAKDRVIGVVEVINKIDGGFEEKDVELAQALTNQAAIAIENTRMYARLADAIVTSRLSYRL